MSLNRRLSIALATALISFTLSLSTAYGQAVSPPSNDWTYHVVPYLWLFGLNGDVNVKGIDAELDVAFSDVIENLDFAGMIHLEAHNGTWGVYLNPIYGALSIEGEVGPIDLDAETELTIIEFGGLYRVGEWALGSGKDRIVRVDIELGGRYWSLENELDAAVALGIGPGFATTVKQDDDWIDLIGGVRIQALLTDKASFLLNANIGGGGSDFSWNLTALGGYQFTDLFTLWAGYRLLDVDYEDGSGSDKFALDAQLGGPIIGFDFRF